MDLFRYAVSIALLTGLCSLAWRLTSGRWRSFAIALIVNSIVVAFLLADAQSIDSWGVFPAAAWAFMILCLIAGLLVLPAIAIWPQARPRWLRASFSVLLVTVWLLAIHTVGVVGAVWDHWKICLPPGYQPEYVDEPEKWPAECEIGPS